MGYPDTVEKRRAGMAQFRRRMLAAHERFANDPKLSTAERARQRELCDCIRATQKRPGEVAQ